MNGETPSDSPGACARCGARARDTARFCKRCGAPLFGDVDTREEGAQRSRVSAPPSARMRSRLADIAHVARLFGLLLGSSLVGGFAIKLGYPDAKAETATTLFDAAIITRYAVRYRADLRALATSVVASFRSGVVTALGGIVAFGVLELYFKAVQGLGAPMLSMTEPYLKSGWSLPGMFLMLSVCPAIFEEIGFRGVIQSALGRVLSNRDAWIVQAALFSVLHLSPLIFPSHFVMGLVFGWARNKNQSLYPGMLLHASWNALVVCEELWKGGGV